LKNRKRKILYEFVLIQVLLLIDNILEFVKDVVEEIDQIDEMHIQMSLLLMLLYLFDKLNFEVVHEFLKDNKDKNKEKYFQ
jgi:hypothetical protein